MASSPVRGLYDQLRDRESAYEMLQAKTAATAAAPEPETKPTRTAREKPSELQSMGEAFAKSMLRSVGSQIGREIMRGLLGGVRRRR